MFTNFWWSLPEALTSLIKPQGKTSIKIKAYKTDGAWYFNAPHLLTWKESLLFPKQLDALADGSNSIWLTISTEPIEGAMKIWLEGHDPLDMSASIYIDPNGEEIWLCKWNQWYFGEKKENLWISKG